MNRIFFCAALSIFFSTTSLLFAEQPEFPKPTKEHQLLEKFVGTWKTQSEGLMGPEQPPMKCEGMMKSRSLGGFWVINEMTGNMMGTPMTGVQTIGFNTDKQKYVGTWVDSMMNHLWQYQGSVDESGTTLTLEAEGPNFMAAAKTTKFRDIYEFKSPDHIRATSSMLGEDGQWVVFMTGDSRRTK